MVNLFKRLIKILANSIYEIQNQKALPNGFVIYKNLLTTNEINNLDKFYNEINLHENMRSTEIEQRFVFRDTALINKTVLEKEPVKEIFLRYSTKDKTPSFVMKNEILQVNSEYGSGGGWHRDSIEPTLKVFIPLTASNKENGSTEYVRNSNSTIYKLLTVFDGLRIKHNKKNKISFDMEVGDIAIADVSGVHRGGIPSKIGRKMLTIYFKNSEL